MFNCSVVWHWGRRFTHSFALTHGLALTAYFCSMWCQPHTTSTYHTMVFMPSAANRPESRTEVSYPSITVTQTQRDVLALLLGKLPFHGRSLNRKRNCTVLCRCPQGSETIKRSKPKCKRFVQVDVFLFVFFPVSLDVTVENP